MRIKSKIKKCECVAHELEDKFINKKLGNDNAYPCCFLIDKKYPSVGYAILNLDDSGIIYAYATATCMIF